MSIYSQGLCFYFDNIDSVEKRSFVACLYFYLNSTLPLKKETLDNTHIPISSWAIEGCNGLIDWTMKSNFTFENLSFTEFVHCNLLIRWLSLGNLVTSQSIKDSRTFQCWKYWSCWKPGVNVMTGCDGYFWYVFVTDPFWWMWLKSVCKDGKSKSCEGSRWQTRQQKQTFEQGMKW